jgi:hypothetical protein
VEGGKLNIREVVCSNVITPIPNFIIIYQFLEKLKSELHAWAI